MEPLVTPDDMYNYPGAPFYPYDLDRFGGRVRGECGWHIAPVVTDIVTLDSRGQHRLHLDTLRLVELVEVWDLVNDKALTDCRASRDGIIERDGGFPVGYGAVRVTFSHGYESCPELVREVIADYARGSNSRIHSETLSGRTVTFFADPMGETDPLAEYRLGTLPS